MPQRLLRKADSYWEVPGGLERQSVRREMGRNGSVGGSLEEVTLASKVKRTQTRGELEQEAGGKGQPASPTPTPTPARPAASGRIS